MKRNKAKIIQKKKVYKKEVTFHLNHYLEDKEMYQPIIDQLTSEGWKIDKSRDEIEDIGVYKFRHIWLKTGIQTKLKPNKMRIKEMISQHRRDFTAMMECEFCGHTDKETSGYDDAYYHQNVIPNMKCRKCGHSTTSKGGEVKPQATKYPEGFVI